MNVERVMEFSDYTVLIVDDEPAYRKFIRTIIEKNFKAKVLEAKNPKECFEILKNTKPSLIIMDMQMPLMDGYTAIKYIRSIPEYQNLPIIACTALNKLELVIRLGELKISDYIVKTSPAGVFIEKIERTLNIIAEKQQQNNKTDISEQQNQTKIPPANFENDEDLWIELK